MGALERLIGFLPIILLFLVPALLGLRRLRRRRQRGEAPGTAPETAAGQTSVGQTAVGQTQAGLPVRDRIERSAGGRQAAGGRAAGAADRSSEAVARGAAGRTVVVPAAVLGIPQREQYVYPPQLRFDRLQASESLGPGSVAATRPPAPPREAERPYRMSPSASLSSAQSGKPGRTSGAAIWRRLQSLPPLQRAIAFAEILGPPRGLGSTGYDEHFDSIP
jgi:hypothetical protein